MGIYRRLINSNWTIVVILTLALIASSSFFFQKTFDSSQFAYHPPFGTIQTGSGLGEDPSHIGRIDPMGGIKTAAGFLLFASIYFIPALLALLAIRFLLRKSNGFISNIVVLLLSIFVGLIFLALGWHTLQLALHFSGF